jgi:NAD(P)-dependent dehydrogenase (short-subunit alcohol dehydrogenase family)
MDMKYTALVTGALKGIGKQTAWELAQAGHHVILAGRKAQMGESVLAEFKQAGLSAEFLLLDVSKVESIMEAKQALEGSRCYVDVLVNNAGVFPDKGDRNEFGEVSALLAPLQHLRDAIETNVYGPYTLCQAFIPAMVKRGYGRVVNVSSGMGQLSEMSGGYPGYRVSKTAINALTRIFSEETKGTGVLVNSVCPGWVKTDMGGPTAPRSLEQGAETIVWLATLPEDGPSGFFFRDKKTIPW